MVQVKALSTGFYGGTRRRPGDIFTVPEADVKAAEEKRTPWFVREKLLVADEPSGGPESSSDALDDLV